jgi:hypothetical protein
MSKLKDISEILLKIAYLPNEDRNSQLENLKTNLDTYSEIDLPREQKYLIQEIIDDLIKENTVTEGSAVVKKKSTKKPVSKIQVKQPEIIKPEPVIQPEPEIKVEPIEELSIEDIDDAF